MLSDDPNRHQPAKDPDATGTGCRRNIRTTSAVAVSGPTHRVMVFIAVCGRGITSTSEMLAQQDPPRRRARAQEHFAGGSAGRSEPDRSRMIRKTPAPSLQAAGAAQAKQGAVFATICWSMMRFNASHSPRSNVELNARRQGPKPTAANAAPQKDPHKDAHNVGSEHRRRKMRGRAAHN